MSRVVRLADRTTGRTVKEFDVTYLTPAEVDAWFTTVGRTWKSPRWVCIWPDHLEEQDAA